MRPQNTETALLQKTLALLSFLVLPILFYILAAFLMAAIFQILLHGAEEGSKTARFLDANLPLLYSGSAALLTSGILGFVYIRLHSNILHLPENPQKAFFPDEKSGKIPSPAKKPALETFFFLADHKYSEIRFPSKRRFPVSGYFYVILFGALGAIFFNLLMELSRLPELLPSAGTIKASTQNAHPLLHALSVCLIVPVAEELVFRGFGYFGLRRFFGPLFTSILTSALFGIFHGNAPQTLYGFCMGLLLAHTAESCRNLTSLLLFHWTANLTSFALLRDPAGQKLLYSIPLLGLSGIACVWLYYRVRELKDV